MTRRKREEEDDDKERRRRDKRSKRRSSSNDSSEEERHRKKRKHHREKKKEKKKKHRTSSSDELDLEQQLTPETVTFEIIQKFPNLVGEFKQLLEILDSGQGVDVSDLPDKQLASLLKKLFHSLSLSRVGQVYLLPEGSAPTSELLNKMLEDERLQVEKNAASAASAAEVPKPRVMGPAMPSADMLEAAAKLTEAEAALREAEAELEKDPFIGPPPPALVAEAESANEAERFEEVVRIVAPNVGNEYEILGVKPDAPAESIKKRYWKLSLLVHPDKCSHPQAQEAFTTINKAFKDLQDPSKRAGIDYVVAEKARKEEEEAELKARRDAAEWRRVRGEEALPGDAELLEKKAKVRSRDEWMTSLPPERKAGPPSMQSKFFSKSEKSGRGDTSMWTDTPLEKAEKAKMQYLEAYKQAALPCEGEKKRSNEVAELVDKYNEKKRSKSLMEESMKKKKKEKKKEKGSERERESEGEWVGKHPWKPWDREKDLVGSRKSENGKMNVGSMSEGLSSRFSSTATQRNFL